MPKKEELQPSGTAHIYLDAHGRARIDDTNVKVIEVAADLYGPDRLTPERMHEEYPHLSMAQIHAALSYYYDRKEEYDAEMERHLREYEEERARQMNSPIRQRLREMGKLP